MLRRSWLIVVILGMALTTLSVFAAPRQTLKVTLQPTEAVLAPGERVHFVARALTPEGTPLELTAAQVSWQVVGKVGTMLGDGLLTAAEDPGRGLVRAVVKMGEAQGVGHALIKVSDASIQAKQRRVAIAITPNVANVPTGGTQQFSVDLAGDVTWRVIPPRLGTIASTGIFMAGENAGRGIVIATVRAETGVGTARASIYVGIERKMQHGSRRDVVVTPRHARVQPGESLTLAVGDAGNGQDPPVASYVWDTSPAHLGTLTSIAPDQALFMAGTKPGRVLVTASFRSDVQVGMGWAMVDIGQVHQGNAMRMRVPMHLRVLPEDITVDIGETVFFRTDTGDAQAQPRWSVMPSQIGRIDQAGVFTPLTPGWGIIIAEVETDVGLSVGQARVFVGTTKRVPLRVIISPSTLESSPDDGPIPLTADVTTTTGEKVTDARLSWQVYPRHIGTIDQNGVFTPGMRFGDGIITVAAQSATGTGSTQVRVRAGNGPGKDSGRIIVSVTGPVRLQVGASAEYALHATTMHKTEADLTKAQISWRIVPSGLGTLVAAGSTVAFTPTQKGRGVLLAEVITPEGNGTGRISVTVE